MFRSLWWSQQFAYFSLILYTLWKDLEEASEWYFFGRMELLYYSFLSNTLLFVCLFCKIFEFFFFTWFWNCYNNWHNLHQVKKKEKKRGKKKKEINSKKKELQVHFDWMFEIVSFYRFHRLALVHRRSTPTKCFWKMPFNCWAQPAWKRPNSPRRCSISRKGLPNWHPIRRT